MLAPALALLLAQAPAAAAPEGPPEAPITPLPPPAHPARVSWALDGAITGGAAITFGILELWVTPQLETPSVPAPEVPEELGDVDAIAVGHFIPAAAHGSDALLITSVSAPLIIHGLEAGLRRDRVGLRYGTDLMLMGEIMAVDLLLTEILKHAVSRPRPYVYANPDAQTPDAGEELAEAQRDPDAYKSFPSGHASLAFAAAVGSATLLTMKWPRAERTRGQRAALGLTWGLSTLVATGTATLRVVAGKHYPSDVLAGMALGSAVGVVVPLAHRRRADLRLTPVAIGPTRALSLSGRF